MRRYALIGGIVILGALAALGARLRAQTAQPSVTVVSPNGRECLQSGRTWNLQWTLAGDLSALSYLNVYVTGPSIDRRSVDSYASVATQHITWPVPFIEESAARLVVEVYGRDGRIAAQDGSDAAFRITAACPADTTPPSAVGNLAAESMSGRPAVKLTWTAPGNDGSFGTADHYEIAHVAGTPAITESGWSALPRALGPQPSVSGSAETYLLENLSGCTLYSFVIRAFDGVSNASRLSNVVTAKTVGVGGAFCPSPTPTTTPSLTPTSTPRTTTSPAPSPSPTSTPALSPSPRSSPTPSPSLPPTPLPRSSPSLSPSVTINDGDIFRASNDFRVYIAKFVGAKKFKRWFVGPQMFDFYRHLGFAQVKVVDPALAASFQESTLIRQEGDGRVWHVDTARATPGAPALVRWVPSIEVFRAANFDWGSVYVVNAAERHWYVTGSVFQP